MLAVQEHRTSRIRWRRPPARGNPPAQEAPAGRQPAGGQKKVYLALGGALVFSGLMRRSWSGLALATLGGCLVYRGLRRAADGAGAPNPRFPHVPPPRADEPLSRETPAAERDEADQLPARTPPASSEEALRSEPDLQTAVPPLEDGPLTAQEHGEAEVIAYFHALERGGGQLPPYDPWRAVEDFCRAAGEVVRRRPGRSVRVNPARPLTTRAEPVLAACAC